MIAVAAVFLVRPARRFPVPPRVVIGQRVATDEGLVGSIEQMENGFALVRTDEGPCAWVLTTRLMDGAEASAAATRTEAVADGAITAPFQHVPPAPRLTEYQGSRLQRFAHGVWYARREVAWGWMIVVAVCIPFAMTAQRTFTSGGFIYQKGDAAHALNEIQDDFQLPIGHETLIVAGPLGEATQRLRRIAPAVMQIDHVKSIGAPQASKDGKLVAIDVYLDGPDGETASAYEPVLHEFDRAFPERDVQVAGTPATYVDTNVQTTHDLERAEMIGLPLAMLVLLFVFGTVVAAVLPLIVGIASVIVTLALLHLISLPLELSMYVMNISTMLGLGLGIDYSLLGVTRFRDELDRGAAVPDAVVTTIMASGRAAGISGAAVVAGVAALAAIPLPVMFSISIGGMVVVAASVTASTTLLPALLGLLGHNVERLAIRKRRQPGELTGGGWYQLAHVVMRHPGKAAVAGIVILFVLASPIRGAHLDVPHDEVLAATTPSQIAKRTLATRFGREVELPVIVIADTADKAELAKLSTQLLGVDHLKRVETVKRDLTRNRTLLNVWGDKSMAMGGPVARDVAVEVRDLDTPVDITVSGQGAAEQEYLDVIRSKMPHTLLLMLVSTFLILTVAFRSITLPLKAIVLDTLSILASLGAIVAVFQNGFAHDLLGVQPLGYTESSIPIILFCLLFGLTMDYEVFMLAKVTELYQEGHDSAEATARGVASTAPLVTGAALILIAIGIGFASTQLVLVKQIGFGMAVALALDATVVRALLLPATMRLLGPANWWLPRTLQRRIPRLEWAH
jgi:RND superfamily putative drug exporter